MISISVGEILQGWDKVPTGARIYIVRDGDLVFYVGVLERPILDHLLEHFGVVVGGPPADRLGRLMLDNAPSSNGWMVDLLSLVDSEPIVREVQPMVRRVDAARAGASFMAEWSRPIFRRPQVWDSVRNFSSEFEQRIS
jgi:hypothetical protein